MRRQHSEDKSGRVLSDVYRLDRKIAQGGMGEVYEATHIPLDKRYAVKILSRRSDGDDGGLALARFEREAQVARALKNEHVVQIVEYQIADQHLPYIVMELLDGEDLAQRLKREAQLPPTDVIRIVQAIAEALDAANAIGIVHRDLKPANVFLAKEPEPDFVKVLDFGVSKMFEWATITSTHTLVGTPQYMSPEQAEGSAVEITHQSDVFSLGVIAYEMLTGKRAFIGKSIPALLYQIVHVDPPTISSLLGPRASALDAVFAQVLAKQPQRRHTSAGKFAAALRASLGTFLPSFALEPEPTDPADELGRKKTTVRKAPGERPILLPSGGSEPILSGVLSGLTHVDPHTQPGGVPLPAFSPIELAIPSGQAEALSPVLSPPLSAAETPRGGRVRVAVAGFSVMLILCAIFISRWRSTPASSSELRTPRKVLPHAEVHIAIRVTPPAARVQLDDQVITGGAAVVAWRAQPRLLRVSMPGFQTLEKPIDATIDRTIDLTLVPEGTSPPAIVATRERPETHVERPTRTARQRPAPSPVTTTPAKRPVQKPTAPVQDL